MSQFFVRYMDIDWFEHAPTCAATDATCPTRWLAHQACCSRCMACSHCQPAQSVCLRAHACVHGSCGFAGARACIYSLRGGNRAPRSVCTLARTTFIASSTMSSRCVGFYGMACHVANKNCAISHPRLNEGTFIREYSTIRPIRYISFKSF